MLNVGQLLDKNGAFAGKLNARRYQGSIVLKPVEKRGDNSPDFDIVAAEGFQTGSAWWKAGKNSRFLTLTLDNDGMSEPLYLTAFPVAGSSGEFDVVWSRPKLQKEATQAA